MSEDLKPIRLKFIFTDGPIRLGRQATRIVDSETGRPIEGAVDGSFCLNDMGRKGTIVLEQFDFEVINDAT